MPIQSPTSEGRGLLRLVSDQSVGFAPVTAVLTGQLTGVDPGDANFCHAAVTWIRIDPGLTEAEGIRAAISGGGISRPGGVDDAATASADWPCDCAFGARGSRSK